MIIATSGTAGILSIILTYFVKTGAALSPIMLSVSKAAVSIHWNIKTVILHTKNSFLKKFIETDPVLFTL
ncbi:hypothetical protein [Pseudobacillus wudalianchiensis]|uniref:hypothetical protein n=1 Tax=Pseudobacillus wudalianchiensis TaxID=1743143 RepID=UPI0011465DBC|nr:hypothetical protein [Bacillus wudalianchiensis]